jgi:hypothetical protein
VERAGLKADTQQQQHVSAHQSDVFLGWLCSRWWSHILPAAQRHQHWNRIPSSTGGPGVTTAIKQQSKTVASTADKSLSSFLPAVCAICTGAGKRDPGHQTDAGSPCAEAAAFTHQRQPSMQCDCMERCMCCLQLAYTMYWSSCVPQGTTYV